MQVKVVYASYIEYFEDRMNKALSSVENIFKLVYKIEKHTHKCIIHYYTKEELRKLKITRLLEPEIIIEK